MFIIFYINLSINSLVPDKMMNKRNAKFSTRHTAGGILVHIDGTAVAAIGYMPQDILGKSVLDFFHPEDLVPLKTAYELLMKNPQAHDGRVSSPPYRFLINNGCYITMETEWTKVFNPWSRKLEFVTGDHCVLRGTILFPKLNSISISIASACEIYIYLYVCVIDLQDQITVIFSQQQANMLVNFRMKFSEKPPL